MRWLLGAIFLLIIGIVFQLGLLVYSMYALLGVILLSCWLARHWIENVTAHRESNRHTVEIGERVAVIVDLSNSSGIPIPWLLVEDSLPRDALSCKPPKLKVDGRRVSLIQMGPNGKMSIRYQLNFATRGYYQIGPLMLESGDLFGLHRRYKVVTEPHFVMVYPKVIPLSGYDLSSRRPIGEIRMAHRLFEDPTRLAGVREYQRGDSFNRIHWKAAQPNLRPVKGGRRDDHSRLSQRHVSGSGGAAPVGTGDHDGRFTSQRRLPDGPADWTRDQRPRRC